MSLRVLHLNFHRGWGGQPARILIGSRELARRGHAIALAVPGDGELARRARAAGLAVYGDFHFAKTRHLVSLLRDARSLKRAIADFHPDLLHSHGSQDTWTTVIANRWMGESLPHVLTRHNSKQVACHAANRYLYGRAIDLLVAVSGGVVERYGEFIRRGLIDPARVPVIHSAIDLERFRGPFDPGSIRSEIGVPAGALLIGSVGRLVPDKGHQFLLRALPIVHASRPDAHLALAGAGMEEAALRRLARELGLDAKVHFLGFRDDVPDIIAALDVAVLASVDCDASPAVVKEAMYLERPVVVTDIGGLREIVDHGVTGLVVPPREPEPLARAILSLVADGRAARRMGETAREAVRTRFTVEALADGYERAYSELLARPAR